MSTLFLASCQEPYNFCPGNQVPYLRCYFTNSSGVIPDSFAIVLTAIDSVIYNDGPTTGLIQIPLQLSSDSTLFHIVFHEDSIDYILIKHESYVRFKSPECGFIIDFEIDTNKEFTNNKVDSIYTLNPIIDDNAYDNLQIFY